MTSKEEISSCNLTVSNGYRMQEVEECSMCGDVGLPQYLFKCLICCHRYQHMYCCKFYPYKIETTICNWCLPMEQSVTHIPEVNGDDHASTKFSNSTDLMNRNTKPDGEVNSDCKIDRQVQPLEKHTRAFEYLLQIAELHDQAHQWGKLLCPIDDDDCIIGKFSERNCDGDYQNNGVCKLNKAGRAAEEVYNHEQAENLTMHQIMIRGSSDDEDITFCKRKEFDKIDGIEAPPNVLMQLRHNRDPAHMIDDHLRMNQDKGRSQIVKNFVGQDLCLDKATKTFTNHDWGHNPAIKKLNSQKDQANRLQELTACPVKCHEIDCGGSDDQSLQRPDTAAGTKRARLHKQLQAAAGSNHRNIHAADQQKMQSETGYDWCSVDSDDLLQSGRSIISWQGTGEMMGAAKRQRQRQSAAQVIAGDNGVFSAATSAAIQGGATARNNDPNDSVAGDQHRVLNTKERSPTQRAWNRPAGKRDHLMGSPSRAIKCRYKLLADVLC